MNASQLGILTATLSQLGPQVYAVMQPVASERILQLLCTTTFKWTSLFEISAPQPLEAHPILVHLGASGQLHQDLLDAAWGNGWGVFCGSEHAMPAVREGLRHLTMARLPDGSTAELRFFAPEVLTCLMPMLDAEQSDLFFRKTGAWAAEADAGQTIRRWHRIGRPARTVLLESRLGGLA